MWKTIGQTFLTGIVVFLAPTVLALWFLLSWHIIVALSKFLGLL